MFPGVKNLLLHNWAVFQTHQDDLRGLSTAMNPMLDAFEAECQKRDVAKVFRWFWDGDIPSGMFARAMRLQALDRPDVQFWVYTRNHEVVPILLHRVNLAVYFSVDRYNVDHAMNLNINSLLKFAFCGDSWEETEELAALFEGERKGPRCPELTGKIPLVVWDEQGTGRGACVECGMCITGINNVRFSSQKVKSNEQSKSIRLTRRASHADA
jgi:Zn ribbon nucleic-acid-binding protein